jgi:thiamine biosynthesis lipoprotein
MPDSFEICLNQPDGNPIHRFPRQAMATEFEIMLLYDDPRYAAQAAFAAFAELDKIENELSRYIDNSDISRINQAPVNQPVVVGVHTFACLIICREMFLKTNGAFDISVGNLADRVKGKTPQRSASAGKDNQPAAHAQGWRLQLHAGDHSVTRLGENASLDLGGIGKGYALDIMAEILKEWGIESALLHGGRSTALSFGELNWPLSISEPDVSGDVILNLMLRNGSLSGSGLQKGRHIIDPAAGESQTTCQAAWSKTQRAAEADALSTAFMILSVKEIRDYCERDSEAAVLLIDELGKKIFIGNWPASAREA